MIPYRLVALIVVGIALYLLFVTWVVTHIKRAARNLDAWDSRRAAKATDERIRADRAELVRHRKAAIEQWERVGRR